MYFEDNRLVTLQHDQDKTCTSQKAIFNYQGIEFEIISILDNPISIKSKIENTKSITFRIAPLGSISYFRKVYYKFFIDTNETQMSSDFVYRGPKEFGSSLIENQQFNKLIRNRGCVFEIQGHNASYLILKPFHGLYNMKQLFNCLDASVIVAKELTF